jgi:glycosidase
MDPPFWWTGMKEKTVQLMVHGSGIGATEPALKYPGVRIRSVTHVPNRNYLFIDLLVEDGAKPGAVDIAFQGGARPVHYEYRLLARAPGSAQRQGFGTRDTIYLIMPDRWSNGNPANDTVAGMPDKLNRQLGWGRHGGDIAGIVDHLDYVAAMGFTQLWPTPLVENDMPEASYHGYAATDHYKIDARYGSNDDYVRMVQEAHKHGLGVIQDVVLSHIGLNHWWLKDLPTPDWINHGLTFTPTQHHRVAVQDPYGSQEDRDNFTTGWFAPHMPDMNQTNPLVANYLIQNNIWWIEYAGLSGLRVDTFGYSDGAFLTQYTRRIMDEYPNFTMVGEEWNKNPSVVAHWLDGKQNFDGYRSYMPSMMDFPQTEAMRDALSGQGGHSLNDVYELTSMDSMYPHPEKLVLFDGNHDTARLFSVVNEDVGLWKIDLAYLMTMPRVPQFYYGTEIQMPSTVKGRDDSSYRRDFPGGWAGDKVNAFTGAGLTPQQRDAQAWVRKLVNWRKNEPVIHSGKMMHFGPENNTYVYFRYNDSKKIMVALNKGDKEAVLPAQRFHEMLGGLAEGTDVMTGQKFAVAKELRLPPKSATIVELPGAAR